MRLYFAAALSTLLLSAASRAQAADLPQRIDLAMYETKQNTILVRIGDKDRTLLFDTGEGLTMISPSVASSIGCHPWGNEVGFRMLGERFEAKRCDDVVFDLAGTPLEAHSTFVYDIATLTGPDAPPLDGAAGLDLFDQKIITLDYPNNALIIESDASAQDRRQHSVEIPLRVTRYANGGLELFLGVKTDNGLAWMTLDSANAGPTIFVSEAIAPLLELKADTREPQPVALQFGGGLKFEGRARVFPAMIMDGNIGMQLLKTRGITLDLQHDRAWVEAGK